MFFRDSCQAESGHLGTTYDCDELSLVSYNSLRDGTSLALPKTAPASLSCQLPFAGGKEELKVHSHFHLHLISFVRVKNLLLQPLVGHININSFRNVLVKIEGIFLERDTFTVMLHSRFRSSFIEPFYF